ncbi:MAG: UDP-glucuronate 4-epimerase [Thermoleophilaceae bacterium]|jgi:nucleoside-diphosphate-sugar epimerase|nr:UDP-glucuronate 4-epimerase [Thermoleophilaceae bacterium]
MADRVLVTGGLGFIGSRLCAALLDEGFAVRCVDDLSGDYAEGVGPAAIPGLRGRGARVAIASAGPEHLRGVDAVVHLAGLPGVRTRRSPTELRDANVGLTERLARAAAARGARFVFVSSSSVYGNASELPTPEHAEPAPLNPYAESKVAAEAAVRACGGDSVIVRPFTVYGPGQRPEMAFARWIAAIGRGEPVPLHAPPGAARDFTYVDDAVAGLIAALRHGWTGRAYNVSGWRSVPLRGALELLGSPELLELPAFGGEVSVTLGCRRRAAAELGYAPRVDLDAGIARQLEAASPRRLRRLRRPRRPRGLAA